MTEDWQLQQSVDGTTLTKTWRDIEPVNPVDFSLEDIVRESAAEESEKLIAGWNRAAAH